MQTRFADPAVAFTAISGPSEHGTSLCTCCELVATLCCKPLTLLWNLLSMQALARCVTMSKLPPLLWNILPFSGCRCFQLV